MNSATAVWEKVLELLKQQMTEVTINTWFDDVEPIALENDRMILLSPTEFKRNILRSRYVPAVEKALRDLFSFDLQAEVLDTEQAERYRSGKKEEEKFLPGSEQYSFETFVVGSSNKFAYTAAQSVCQHLGENYNPLFIYGQSGLGKTHLLYAIARKVHADHPDFRIRYVKSEEFVNEYINIIRMHRDTEEFRDKNRNADLFLMDDVQFVAGKDACEVELFHTFNTLHDRNKQIVFTADRLPSEMTRLEDRLRTRFEWGLPVDIQPPDYETRVAIIKDKALSRGMNIPDPVLSYLAENITANVRQMEGVVNRMMALHELMGQEVDVDATIRAVRDILRQKNDFLPSAGVVIQEVARYYEMDSETIRGQSQNKDVVMARSVAIYLTREMTKLSLQEIGKEFGGRHHATILNSINRVDKMKKERPELSEILRDLTTAVNGAC